MSRNFSLVRLTLILVLAGLLAGGMLMGKDFIRAATARATVAQMEQYNAEVGAFRARYRQLPGDMNRAAAHTFGFAARGAFAGEGDGNGIIEGIGADAADSNNGFLQSGETTLFWRDLAAAASDGTFIHALPDAAPAIAADALGDYFPPARLGHGNYIYVYSTEGVNYYGISLLSSVATGGRVISFPGMTARQAEQMDEKVDDGLPATGNVTATYATGDIGENGAARLSPHASDPPAAADCYSAGENPAYAVNAKGNNCALSFRFQ